MYSQVLIDSSCYGSTAWSIIQQLHGMGGSGCKKIEIKSRKTRSRGGLTAARRAGVRGREVPGRAWEGKQQVDWEMTHEWAEPLHDPAETAAAALPLPSSMLMMMARNTHALPFLLSSASLSP